MKFVNRLFCGAMCLLFSVNTTFCALAAPEDEQAALADSVATMETQQESPFVMDFKCKFIYFPDTVVVGKTMAVEVNCENYGDEFVACAYFTVTGVRVPDYTMTGFWMRNDRRATFYWHAAEEYLNREVAIGFVIERQGTVIYNIEKNVSVTSYDVTKDIKAIVAMVKPVYVEATLRYTTNKYSDVNLKNKIGTIYGGTKVICIASKSDFSNQISLPDGSTCWVALSSLNISTKNYTNPVDMTKEEKEVFINAVGYVSDTPYLIWINLERQRTNIFLKESGRWELIRTSKCATGTNPNPTSTGIYKYYAKQKSWDYDNYYVAPILIFNGNYAMHSVLMNYNGTIYDGTVGRPASHGCVRMLPEDINWIDYYIPRGSTVLVK